MTRIKQRYLLLPELLSKQGSRIRAVEDANIKAAFSAADIGGAAATVSAGQRVLILGQYCYVWNPFSWEEELAHYLAVCRQLAPLGELFWKEHPKNPRPFYDALAVEVPTLQNFETESEAGYPVELTISRGGFTSCVSATSTALFTLPKLTGIRSYTFVDRLIGTLVGADAEVAALIREHISPLQELAGD